MLTFANIIVQIKCWYIPPQIYIILFNVGKKQHFNVVKNKNCFKNMPHGNGLYFVHIIDPQGNTIDIRKIVLQ